MCLLVLWRGEKTTDFLTFYLRVTANPLFIYTRYPAAAYVLIPLVCFLTGGPILFTNIVGPPFLFCKFVLFYTTGTAVGHLKINRQENWPWLDLTGAFSLRNRFITVVIFTTPEFLNFLQISASFSPQLLLGTMVPGIVFLLFYRCPVYWWYCF